MGKSNENMVSVPEIYQMARRRYALGNEPKASSVQRAVARKLRKDYGCPSGSFSVPESLANRILEVDMREYFVKHSTSRQIRNEEETRKEAESEFEQYESSVIALADSLIEDTDLDYSNSPSLEQVDSFVMMSMLRAIIRAQHREFYEEKLRNDYEDWFELKEILSVPKGGDMEQYSRKKVLEERLNDIGNYMDK